jgi:hypothetical protein
LDPLELPQAWFANVSAYLRASILLLQVRYLDKTGFNNRSFEPVARRAGISQACQDQIIGLVCQRRKLPDRGSSLVFSRLARMDRDPPS